MVVTYSPDSTVSILQEVNSLNVYGRSGWLKVVKSMGVVPVDLFRHFCCRMYHLATIHRNSVRKQRGIKELVILKVEEWISVHWVKIKTEVQLRKYDML